MTPRGFVEHEGIRYVVSSDDPARGSDLAHWAVLRARVVDELTLEPPRAPLTLTTTLRNARVRVGDGLVGLVARPRDVARALLRPDGFRAEVTAPGYLPRDLAPAIERARRSSSAAAAAGATRLDVVPPDPERAQFGAGRGVLVERAVPAGPDSFTTVAATAAAPAPGEVPLARPLDVARPVGTRVVGLPLALADQALHRAGTVRIRGRARRRNGAALVPAPAARIALRGVWWDYPSSITGAPRAPELCGVAPGLRGAHAVGASVHGCTLAPLGAPRRVHEGATAGARALVVAPAGGLNPLGDDLLRIGDPVTGDDEVVVTAGFRGQPAPDAPVRVELRAPTGRLHRAREPVVAVHVLATTLVGSVMREALPGDEVLFASGLVGLPTTAVLVVEHATPRAEFLRATQPPSTPDGVAFRHLVTPDAEGRFAWPPLARVARLRVSARLGGDVQQLDVVVDGDGAVLDLVFS